jgi:hypothetical protein
LRYRIGRRVDLVSGPGSDGLGEFGKGCGDPQYVWGVDGEFVMSAA